MLLKKYKINNNLSYFYYPTKKYKSFSVKIYFLLPYDKNKITIRNLLKSVLLYNTEKYNEVELIEKKKELSYEVKYFIEHCIEWISFAGNQFSNNCQIEGTGRDS